MRVRLHIKSYEGASSYHVHEGRPLKVRPRFTSYMAALSRRRTLTSRPVASCLFPSRVDFLPVLQGQKDYGRCLRLSPCCVASSSSSPDSVKGAALRSNSRYTSSQSRRATANRQVGFSSPTNPPTVPQRLPSLSQT